MKIQFIKPYEYDDIVAEFDVDKEPTKEQCEAIENDVFEAMGEYELENGDYTGFDWWGVCFEAAKKHSKLVDNPVVKIFYL